MFQKAKGFSDFIGFHVRFQFVVLSAYFVLAPSIIRMNAALRDGTEFQTDAGLVEYVAVTGLAVYALVLLIFILAVGCGYLKGHIDLGKAWPKALRYSLVGILCLLFIGFELILNIAVAVAGFGRVIEAFGVGLDEIVLLNEQLWQRVCPFWADGCP